MLVSCVQYVELAYLAYKGYWVYSVIFGLLAVVALAAVVSAKMKQHRSLVGLVKQQGIMPIVQGGWVRAIPSYRLVPGDIIVLQQGRPTCDVVLLQGSCLVSEAMISGEVVMLCCSALCCAVLQCAMLCCAAVRYAVLRCSALCCVVLQCAMLCCAAVRYAVLSCAVLCCASISLRLPTSVKPTLLLLSLMCCFVSLSWVLSYPVQSCIGLNSMQFGHSHNR